MSEYLMYADVEFSRRKTFHHIINKAQDVVWSGKSLLGALNWLVEQNVYEFRIEGLNPARGFQVMIHRD